MHPTGRSICLDPPTNTRSIFTLEGGRPAGRYHFIWLFFDVKVSWIRAWYSYPVSLSLLSDANFSDQPFWTRGTCADPRCACATRFLRKWNVFSISLPIFSPCPTCYRPPYVYPLFFLGPFSEVLEVSATNRYQSSENFILSGPKRLVVVLVRPIREDRDNTAWYIDAPMNHGLLFRRLIRGNERIEKRLRGKHR